MKKFLLFFIFSMLMTFNYTNVQAQRRLVDEWEASIGYLNFQGDYGQRSDFTSTFGSAGGMIGAKMYLNLLDEDRVNCYSCQHFKFNLAINTGYSTLNFNRAYNKFDNLAILKIKAISGQVYFFDLAANVEYHLSNLRNIDFFSSSIFNKIDPYVGVGFGGIFYNVDVDSALGNFEKDPSILPSAFQPDEYGERAFNESKITASANLEVGIRYRFSQDLQLNFNNKWMYFFSDRVDGLVPDPEEADNLYNDWLFSPSLGVVIFIY